MLNLNKIKKRKKRDNATVIKQFGTLLPIFYQGLGLCGSSFTRECCSAPWRASASGDGSTRSLCRSWESQSSLLPSCSPPSYTDVPSIRATEAGSYALLYEITSICDNYFFAAFKCKEKAQDALQMQSGMLLLLMMEKHRLGAFPTPKLLAGSFSPTNLPMFYFILSSFLIDGFLKLFYAVSQPDRAREPIAEPGAGLPLGSLAAALRPGARRAPRPRRVPHQARFWSRRYARYCIHLHQVCAVC